MIDKSVKLFKNFFYNKGYVIYENKKLRTDDKTILFKNSTIVDFKDTMNKSLYIPSTAVIQKCFRNNANTDSFSYFTMVGIVGSSINIKNNIRDFIEYLNSICKLEIRNLTVVYDKKSEYIADYCREFYENLNFYQLNGYSDKFSVDWTYGEGYNLKGNGITIVYSNDNINKCSPKCNINCDCSKHMQIGNFIDVKGNNKRYVDFGFGLERIISSKYKGDLYKIYNFDCVIKAIEGLGYNIDSSKILINNTISLQKIISENFIPSSKKEGYISRKLIRQIGNIILLYGKGSNIVEEYSVIYKLILGQVSSSNELKIIELELSKYIEIINQNIKKIEKLLSNGEIDLLDNNFISNIKSTYGLPEFLINKVLEGREVHESE